MTLTEPGLEQGLCVVCRSELMLETEFPSLGHRLHISPPTYHTHYTHTFTRTHAHTGGWREAEDRGPAPSAAVVERVGT